MGQIFVIFIAALTSVVAYQTTQRTLPQGSASMRQAARALFEWIGAFAFFVVFNLALGAVIIVLIRSLTARFIALYDLGSVLLFVLSGAQGFLFQIWWKRN